MTNTAHPAGVTKGQHSFAQVPGAEIPRSVFDRSSNLKTTFDAGLLVPIFADEALPGDTFKMHANLFARMATPIWPVMDNFFMDTFWFAVPNRLLWDNWEKFNGAQTDPGDSTDFLLPEISETVDVGSFSDYMGIPPSILDVEFCALWHRAYNLIWNEWFRDENLQDSVIVNRSDGPDDPLDYTVLRRGKRHDYFSSCLPFAQKGASVELPLGSSAPISSTGDGIPLFNTVGGQGVTNFHHQGGGANPDDTVRFAKLDSEAASPFIWSDPKLEADLSAATAATINQIREAFQVQRLLERDARGGTRYTEIVRSHFGVSSPDARLQRPEYLGGSSTRINVTPVAQSTNQVSTEEEGQVGRLAGFATAADSPRWLKTFTEHCVIIGLVNVRADLTYQQGLDRMFSRRTRFDMYWPALAHLGEQEVLLKEIYLSGIPASEYAP